MTLAADWTTDSPLDSRSASKVGTWQETITYVARHQHELSNMRVLFTFSHLFKSHLFDITMVISIRFSYFVLRPQGSLVSYCKLLMGEAVVAN